ncbi:MAG: beta-ketoacyl-ACP synthase II [Verrucomicrobia bacterium]|nr:beta-ketoacyl-ACP synthase II [Verrucomicrobiota bacterium]MDA1086720.1 beta-ketoacyl-ACP synthase II [Verrucomicrobiota bacterium]
MRTVVITGLGVVTPLGCRVDTVWERIRAGQSGIGPITGYDASQMPCRIAGEVAELDLDAFLSSKEQRRLEPFMHFGVVAARMAVEDAGIEIDRLDARRAGVVVGSGIGGITTLERQHIILRERGPDRNSPFMIPQMIINMAAGVIAIEHGFRGPNYAAVSACSTAAHCIGNAMRHIQHGEADMMLAGGAEAAVTALSMSGFSAMKALSTRNDEPGRASRPFDADRDGFVMGEGAGIVMLEELEHARRRGASIYCELAGYGLSCDAHHITAPVEGGEGAADAMLLAIADAGHDADQIEYINAHGTSTMLNDSCETAAIKRAFGDDRARGLLVSSTKSMTGHLLGAAAGLETVICALVLRDGVVPPTMNYETPDPNCDLDYVPNEAREAKVNACLNNALGFGGHNTSLLLRKLV